MNQSKLNPARLAEVAVTPLGKGSHVGPDDGMCVMEAAAYVAGEAWGASPQCVCPVITKLLVSWNDNLPTDAERGQLLKPLIPLIVGTRSTPAVENTRRYLALDWLVRVHTPAWLALRPELLAHAEALRGLEAITDLTGALTAGSVLRAAREAAYDEAWPTGWAAAGEAWAAAGGYATRDAAGTALWSAAGGEVAGDAARAATWDTAGAYLAPTTALLQLSAVDLVARMCAVNEF